MSKIDDGYIYISYILEPLSRCELFKILLKLNNGKYIYDKNVIYIKTKQFSLDTKNGKIVVDGELQDFKNIHCQILKNKIQYLS